MHHLVIRPEQPEDAPAISALVRTAFLTQPHSNANEATIVERLRDRGELTVSVVALRDGELVGHVAFSPVTLTPMTSRWFGLAPLSVLPQQRHRGLGAALVMRGLSQLRMLKAHGCVVYGCAAYYRRFGFRRWECISYAGGEAANFLAMAFEHSPPRASVTYSPAFHGD